jgi:hypothetical protein
MNLTYLNVTLTGMLRWKLYLQDKDFHSFTYCTPCSRKRGPPADSRCPFSTMREQHAPKQTTAVGTLSSLQLEADLSVDQQVDPSQLNITGSEPFLYLCYC